MAKSLRSSTRKANNAKLKKTVFGPIEAARADRLSAKLLELAAQPKPKAPEKDTEMEDAETEDGAAQAVSTGAEASTDNQESMDLDSATKPAPSKKSRGNKKIEKRRSKKKSSVVFPSFKDRAGTKKRR